MKRQFLRCRRELHGSNLAKPPKQVKQPKRGGISGMERDEWIAKLGRKIMPGLGNKDSVFGAGRLVLHKNKFFLSG